MLSILHCISEYPTPIKRAQINSINALKKFKYVVGFSDHTEGNICTMSAVTLGAKIIEKHITLDRRMKGTDQVGSLGPDGLYRMVRNIRTIDKSFGLEEISIAQDTKIAKQKLERSIATNKKLFAGHTILEKDIHLLSPGDGLRWSQKSLVIGRRLKSDIAANELIYEDNLSL